MAIDYEVVSVGALQPGKFRVRPRSKGLVTYNDWIEAAALRSNLSPQHVRAATDGMLDEMYDRILQGYAVQFRDYGRMFVRMRQTFDTPDGGFDPGTGQASLQFRVSAGWEQRLEAAASFNKVAADEVEPHILNIYDVATATNDQATVGGIVRITGDRLDFDPADALQGVFFDPGALETRVTVYESVGDVIVVCLVPLGLLPGPYTLRVKAKYTPAGTLRTGEYNTPVTLI